MLRDQITFVGSIRELRFGEFSPSGFAPHAGQKIVFDPRGFAGIFNWPLHVVAFPGGWPRAN
jgi:hypothetical protein